MKIEVLSVYNILDEETKNPTVKVEMHDESLAMVCILKHLINDMMTGEGKSLRFVLNIVANILATEQTGELESEVIDLLQSAVKEQRQKLKALSSKQHTGYDSFQVITQCLGKDYGA